MSLTGLSVALVLENGLRGEGRFEVGIFVGWWLVNAKAVDIELPDREPVIEPDTTARPTLDSCHSTAKD